VLVLTAPLRIRTSLQPGTPPGFFIFMDQTQIDLRERFIDASGELAAMLEPKVFALWQAEWRAFIDAQERGEDYVMTPLARAITGVIWEHVTTGEQLFFPPEIAAHYHRAPRAHLN